MKATYLYALMDYGISLGDMQAPFRKPVYQCFPYVLLSSVTGTERLIWPTATRSDAPTSM
jgi:hypothetical protein